MEFIPELSVVLLLMAATFMAGLIDAIAGGGGLITLPALLFAGVPPHVALGTNKLAGTFGTFNAARIYVARGIFEPRRWLAAIVATFIGAVVGTLCTRLMSAETFAKFLPLVILATAVYMLLPKGAKAVRVDPPPRPHPGKSTLLGSVLGFYDGFSGPGTGAFWTTLAMKLFQVDIVSASGIARFMNFVSNVVSLFTFMALGTVNYALGLLLGGCVMAGAYVGAHSAIRYGQRLIRPVFVAVVFAISARLAWTEWFA